VERAEEHESREQRVERDDEAQNSEKCYTKWTLHDASLYSMG
jgi:hypothetical protein